MTGFYEIEQINKKKFDKIPDVEDELIKKFPEMFLERIGLVPNIKVYLYLLQSAKPVSVQKRDVLYAIKEEVEQKLDSLEDDRIISKVNHKDWGSALFVQVQNLIVEFVYALITISASMTR